MNVRVKDGWLVAAALAVGLSLAACDQPTGSRTAGSAADRPGENAAMPAPDVTSNAGKAADANAGKAADDAVPAAQSAMAKASKAADDVAITLQVKTALLADAGLKSLQISVETEQATVTLAGNVDSESQRDRAKQIASGVSGVERVVDLMTVNA